jgi:predicted RNA binding protein YcfA (HicA-like mRNA interferase family)
MRLQDDRISGAMVVRALKRAGFVVDRIAGSHHVLVYPNDPTRTVTVPVHSGRDLKPGTLRGHHQADWP